jgi:hypothetical protein
MWIIGTFVSYLFYRFAFVWYFSLWFANNPLQRPLRWRSPWFHIGVFLISITLFLTSAYFFYLSYPWLAFSPIPLAILSYIAYSIKRGAREARIIHKAVEIQVRMEKQGTKQPEINRAIAISTIGDHDPACADFGFTDFLKYGILNEAGLLRDKDPEMSIAQLQEIDRLITKRRNIEERKFRRS